MPAAAHTRNMHDKARRLIADGRCHTIATVPGKLWTGIVDGDTGRYLVTSVDHDVVRHLSAQAGAAAPTDSCQCSSFAKTGSCSHTAAGQALRVASTPVEELFATL